MSFIIDGIDSLFFINFFIKKENLVVILDFASLHI